LELGAVNSSDLEGDSRSVIKLGRIKPETLRMSTLQGLKTTPQDESKWLF